MRPETWLESLLGNKWRIKAVRALLRDPARMWTERELAKAVGASPNTMNLTVAALRDHGVLEFRRLGRSNAIRLRADLGLIKQLRNIFAQETSVMDEVRKAIRDAAPEGVTCRLFGSTARYSAHEESDIDLLVTAATRDKAEEGAATIRRAVSRVFPAPLSIAALGRTDLRRRSNEPWLRNALAEGEALTDATAGDTA